MPYWPSTVKGSNGQQSQTRLKPSQPSHDTVDFEFIVWLNRFKLLPGIDVTFDKHVAPLQGTTNALFDYRYLSPKLQQKRSKTHFSHFSSEMKPPGDGPIGEKWFVRATLEPCRILL